MDELFWETAHRLKAEGSRLKAKIKPQINADYFLS
jgi:hypothetical protein